ncbi:MAG: hypothetical protein OES09_12290 [Gammaproteobacteria bacterium]|nr:hypothetical protein [Gammaproteobacteria bacterium]
METSCELRITEDATEGRRLQIAWQDNKFHVSGVVCLNRLEGEDPKGERYSEKYFVAHVGSCPIAYSRVVWDRIDRRARILCVHTLFHGLQGLMLNTIVNWLQATSTEQKLTIVVDVRADYPALHYTLEELGFFPTVYYPGLVSGEGGRVDVVQFTWLFGYDFADSLQWTGKVDWSEAKKVTGVVANLASGAVSEL